MHIFFWGGAARHIVFFSRAARLAASVTRWEIKRFTVWYWQQALQRWKQERTGDSRWDSLICWSHMLRAPTMFSKCWALRKPAMVMKCTLASTTFRVSTWSGWEDWNAVKRWKFVSCFMCQSKFGHVVQSVLATTSPVAIFIQFSIWNIFALYHTLSQNVKMPWLLRLLDSIQSFWRHFAWV